MLRKLLLASLTSLALLLPLAMTSSAQACGPYGGLRLKPHRIFFREYGATEWQLKAAFRTSAEAMKAMDELRAEGFEVKWERL